jgi:hypothetical protein
MIDFYHGSSPFSPLLLFLIPGKNGQNCIFITYNHENTKWKCTKKYLLLLSLSFMLSFL